MDDRRKPHSGGFSGRGPDFESDAASFHADQGGPHAQNPQPTGLPPIDEASIDTAWVEEALEGDPFGIEAACWRCREERAYLVEVHRYLVWTVAHFELVRPKDLPVEDMNDLVEQIAEQALLALVAFDEELHSSGWTPGVFGDPRYAYLSEAFELEPGQCLAAQVRFNELHHSVRKAFFELVLLQRSVTECLDMGLSKSKKQLLYWVERAL